MTTIIKPLEAKRVLRRKVPGPTIANKANSGGLQAKSDFLTPRQAGERHNVLTRLKNGIVSQYRVESKSNGGFIDDLAVVLCHWGNGKEQVSASKRGLADILAMKPCAKVVFVEAQFSSGVFSFKPNDNAYDYIPIELGEGQRGMFLKESLWNIGARRALSDKAITKVLFLDADCSYVDTAALSSVAKTLDACDVCSGHAYSYYCNQVDSHRHMTLAKSVCCSYLKDGKADGHAGFSIGMTRAFFERIGGLPAITTVAGDTWFWFYVFGQKRRYMPPHIAPHNYGNIQGFGVFPFPKVGCAGEILCHHYHGKMRDRLYHARRVISRSTTTSLFEDRTLGDDGLPSWSDTVGASIAKDCHLELNERIANNTIGNDPSATARGVYDKIAEKHYGEIGDGFPLVISTAFRAGGPYTHKHVVMLRDLFAKFCLTPHTFICVTNENIEGVDCRPFITTDKITPYYYSQLELYRKDLYPENASVLTCDLDAIPIRPFTLHRCPSNSIAMGHELHNWNLSSRVVWNGGVTYFNGDFSHVIEDFINESKVNGPSHPFFTFISSQEYMAGNLYKHGVAIHDLLAHLPFEFYNGNDKGDFNPYSYTKMVHFLFQPKPWTLKNKPSWLPQEAFSIGGGGAYQSTGATKP